MRVAAGRTPQKWNSWNAQAPWTRTARIDAVDACLRRLIDSRRLIVAFHLLGHDLAESEQLSGWGAKRVRNLLYRGLADLRHCLTAKGFTS